MEVWYMPAAQLVLTAVLAYATWRLWQSTKLLADETRLRREESKKPNVVVKLKAYKDHGDFIQLVITNIGQGAAFDVNFLLEGDQGVLGEHGVLLRGTVAPIGFMASGESELYEMGSRSNLFDDPVLDPFPVVVTYADVDDKTYRKEITLDVRQFELLQWRGESVAWRQMAAVENLAKTFRERR